MRINAKGQVTIPKTIRDVVGLAPGTDVEFEIDAGGVFVRKSTSAAQNGSRGRRLVESLRGRGDFGMTTDEVIALMRGPGADEV